MLRVSSLALMADRCLLRAFGKVEAEGGGGSSEGTLGDGGAESVDETEDLEDTDLSSSSSVAAAAAGGGGRDSFKSDVVVVVVVFVVMVVEVEVDCALRAFLHLLKASPVLQPLSQLLTLLCSSSLSLFSLSLSLALELRILVINSGHISSSIILLNVGSVE